MIDRTYLDSFSTIIKDSSINIGINPICELCYGANVTRGLIHFDIESIKRKLEDKTYADSSKLKHMLKVTNAGSIDFRELYSEDISDISDAKKLRAASFDIIFFKIPKEWDGGKGFDYSRNFLDTEYYSSKCGISSTSSPLSTDGVNWYNSRNGIQWDEEGIYSNETLTKEYDKFAEGKESVIIAKQRFNIGNEPINVDITDYVNGIVSGIYNNYGIGFAFSPMLESSASSNENYVGFFTNKTNTFFEPFIETIYDDHISDDRSNFILSKNNKIYFYSSIGGTLDNLDEMPKCSIDGTFYDVKQFSKGIYYIEVKLDGSNCKPNTIKYDVWSNIKYGNTNFDDVENEFVVKGKEEWFNFGSSIQKTEDVVPNLYGINSGEKIKRGDIRKIGVLCRIPYTNKKCELIDDVLYRIYAKDGTREIDVIKYDYVNKTFDENFFYVDTNIMIPNKYYIDIRIDRGGKTLIHHNVVSFTITDDLNNRYL